MFVRHLHNLLIISDLYHAGQICPDKFNLSVFFFLERGELYSQHSYPCIRQKCDLSFCYLPFTNGSLLAVVVDSYWVFSYLFYSHISLDGAKLRIKYQIQKIKRQKKERRASQPASPERFIENATHGIPILLIKNIVYFQGQLEIILSPTEFLCQRKITCIPRKTIILRSIGRNVIALSRIYKAIIQFP